jgi:2-polyprenyl-3-methyl-5-hydroxy-6-metoxy-1,4-benzoquinol methylase
MTTLLDEVICCPVCRSAQPLPADGAYACPSCEWRFPILNGIPRLLEEVPQNSKQVQQVFDFEHRRFRDSWYTRFDPRLVEQFLDDCRLPREFFRDRRALDAGCGSGRWSYALAELGADLVAFDLTEGGIEAASEHLAERENVSLCQANLFHPPFAAESFDFVMSWGVLHHTPDTHAAFRQLVPLVKPGGTLYVMVYERHSPVMFFFTNIVRSLMRRLPDERRYRACRRLIVHNRLLARVLGRFLMISYREPGSPVDEQTLQFGLYDAYSPRYNHLHTRAEVRGWFADAGFEDVTVIEAPGSVKVRGVRGGRDAPAPAAP